MLLWKLRECGLRENVVENWRYFSKFRFSVITFTWIWFYAPASIVNRLSWLPVVTAATLFHKSIITKLLLPWQLLSVVVKTTPTKTKTLLRPESTERETRPRHFEVKTETRPRAFFWNNMLYILPIHYSHIHTQVLVCFDKALCVYHTFWGRNMAHFIDVVLLSCLWQQG